MLTGQATVPFVDLKRQHRAIGRALREAYDRVLDQDGYTLGGEVEAFESEFADSVGTEHAIGVASGTDALHLTLRACGIGSGDEVLLPANTFAATAEAIVMCGARPVFVDCERGSYLIDLDRAEDAVTPSTRAIVPVHLYGQCVDMRRVGEMAQRHGLRVIEDACQAHGASRSGLGAGSAGDAGCFSFYPSKNLGALGDGGMVTTSDPGIAGRVRSLRNHGEGAKRLHTESGYCSRLHGLQAAFLRAKLPMLAEWNEMRAEGASAYREYLSDSGCVLPEEIPDGRHVYHLFVVQVADRDGVRARLAERGIQTGIHYALPLHLEPAFEAYGPDKGALPVAEAACSRILSLPMFPYLVDEEVRMVADALKDAIDA